MTVEIRLSNRSLLPKIVLTLHDDCPLAAPGEEPRGFLIGALRPGGRTVASYEVQSYRRGLYSFAPLRVETAAPFGLFRSTRSIAAPLEATVYPKVAYYDPMEKRIAEKEAEWKNVPDAVAVLDEARDEIATFRRNSDYFSYAFFVMRK